MHRALIFAAIAGRTLVMGAGRIQNGTFNGGLLRVNLDSGAHRFVALTTNWVSVIGSYPGS